MLLDYKSTSTSTLSADNFVDVVFVVVVSLRGIRLKLPIFILLPTRQGVR